MGHNPSWEFLKMNEQAMTSPLILISFVIICVMTVVRTITDWVAHLQIGVRVIDDIPESVLILLDPDYAAAVGT